MAKHPILVNPSDDARQGFAIGLQSLKMAPVYVEKMEAVCVR